MDWKSAVEGWDEAVPVVEEKPVQEEAKEPIAKRSFVNLHHHDEYSLGSALGGVAEALKVVKQWGHSHYAVTNYGEISGWVSQYFKCIEADIVPILSIEAFVNNYRVKEAVEDDKPVAKVSFCGMGEKWTKAVMEMSPEEKDKIGPSHSLLLYAATMQGYSNVIKIHNDAQLQGYYDRPRACDSFIAEHGEGVIAVLPIISGEVFKLLASGEEQEALEKYQFYKSVFDRVYMELVLFEKDGYSQADDLVIRFADKNDIPLIVTVNSHYIAPEFEGAYEILLKIGKGGGKAMLADVAPNMSMRDVDDMRTLFQEQYENDTFTAQVFDKCLSNITEVCSMVPVLELDRKPKLPTFPNAAERLRENAVAGLKRRLLSANKQYVDRLEYELDNVVRAGFADYFLFLEDMVAWCRKNRVLVGPGRGSAAGCLILYCLDITQVDPIRYNLLFERFLDASRLDDIVRGGGEVTGDDLPDVDLDFSDRDKVVGYLSERYGENNTCSIGTVGRMRNKSALIDISRALEIELDNVYRITKGEMGKGGLEEDKLELDELRVKYPQLDAFLSNHPEIEKHHSTLRGAISFWGRHAGGVLVSDSPIVEELPVRRVDKLVVSCWSEGLGGRELGMLGFVKMDLLEVDTLHQIQMALDLIEQTTGRQLDMYSLPLEDQKAFRLCNSGDNMGIFQFDGYSSEAVIREMGGVRCFMDYSHASALMRPASLGARLPSLFGRRRDGEEVFEVPACIQNELGSTYGLTIYQESAYHIAHRMCGFTIVEAYKFMKLLYKSKMTEELVPYWYQKFMDGASSRIESGELEEEYVDMLFQNLLQFQGYGFCKAHAVSYAMFSAWMLYLKVHFYKEFMCCLLRRTSRSAKDRNGKSILEQRIRRARKKGLHVSSPDVNESKQQFSISREGVRFGLSGMKGISSAADMVISNQPFETFPDFCDRVDSKVFHKGRMESMIFSGALDRFADRETMYNWYHLIHRRRSKKDENTPVFDLFAGSELEMEAISPDSKGYRMFSEGELLAMEKDILGMVLSQDLIGTFKDIIAEKELRLLEEVRTKHLKKPVIFGQVVKVQSLKSKKGATFVRVELTDGFDDTTLILNESGYDCHRSYFVEGNVLGLPAVFRKGSTECYLNDRKDIIVLRRVKAVKT